MRIVLVGAEIEENLSIRSIAAFLVEHGHEVRLAPFSRAADQPAVLARVDAWRPDLVGLSMVFQLRAGEFMTLATAMRAAGFEGHITCGGHFATFNPEAILAACPAIDSVVRHEGEHAMDEMARALEHGRPLSDLDGLVLRGAEGTTCRTPSRRPPDDLDALPFPIRDEQPPCHLDVRVASIVGSRGCYANCAFCCINAWHRASGGRRLRQRSPRDVVAEMARLHHERGVRLFIFHDDNFFVPSKQKNLARFSAMREEMRAAGLVDVGLVVKARPNDVDREVFELLVDMGLVRVYLGIENGSEGGLLALNRLVGVEQNEQALRVLDALGVFACFNLLIFEPDTRLAHIADNVAFMRRHLDVPHNYCRAEAYTASALHARLAEQGRLQGSWLAPDYVISDPSAETLFRIFAVALFERNFGRHSSANMVMGTKYHLHLLRRFHPSVVTPSLEARVRGVVVESNRLGVDLLAEALDFVSGTLPDVAACGSFALDLARRAAVGNDRINQQLRALDAEMEARAVARPATPPRREASALKAAAVLPMLALSLLSAGCDPRPNVVDPVPPPSAAPSQKPSAAPSGTATPVSPTPVPPPVDMVPPPTPPPIDMAPPPHPPVDPAPPPTAAPRTPTPRVTPRKPGATPTARPPVRPTSRPEVVDPPPPPSPPVVDPLPPPGPSPRRGPTGLLPRTLQGEVTAIREGTGWRLRVTPTLGAGVAVGDGWQGGDGTHLRWGATEGVVRVHDDGSATCEGGGLAWCEVRTADGAVWLASQPL